MVEREGSQRNSIRSLGRRLALETWVLKDQGSNGGQSVTEAILPCAFEGSVCLAYRVILLVGFDARIMPDVLPEGSGVVDTPFPQVWIAV